MTNFLKCTTACATISLSLLASTELRAQGTYCGLYGPGSPIPPDCMLAKPAGSSTSTTTIDITDIEKASYAKPVTSPFPKGSPAFGYYNLKFDKLCDAGGLNAIVSDWVGPRKGSFDLIHQDRNVAMAAVLTFPEAKKDQTKQVKIPLIVKANFGDANVQNCDGSIMSDIPANQTVNLHFEFKRRSVVQFTDQSKFLGGVLKVASGGAGLVSYSGSHVFAPVITGVVVSFLQKNTEPVKNITEGMNDILGTFADESNPDPKQYRIDINASQNAYKNGKKMVFSVSKETRASIMVVNPARGWMPVGTDFSSALVDIQPLYTNAQTAVDSPWSANLSKFCEKLRLQINSATKGDRIATALGIGFHAFVNNTEYPKGKTCLNSWEVTTLASLGYAPPFDGAWDTQVVGKKPVNLASLAGAIKFAQRLKLNHYFARGTNGRHMISRKIHRQRIASR